MSNNAEGDHCTICLEPLELEKIAALACRHVFHYECILKWAHSDSRSNTKACPNCKQMIRPSTILGPLHYTPRGGGISHPSTPTFDRSMYVSKQEYAKLRRSLDESKELLHETSQSNTELRTQNKYFKRLKGIMEFNTSLSTPTAQARMRSWKHLPQDEISLILGGLHQRLRDAERVVEKQQTELSHSAEFIEKLKKELDSTKRKLKKAEQRADATERGLKAHLGDKRHRPEDRSDAVDWTGSEQQREKRQGRRRIYSDDEDTTDDETSAIKIRVSPISSPSSSTILPKITLPEDRRVNEGNDITTIASDDSDDDEVTLFSVNERSRRSVRPKRLYAAHQDNSNASSSSCYTHVKGSSHRAASQPRDVIDLLSDSG